MTCREPGLESTPWTRNTWNQGLPTSLPWEPGRARQRAVPPRCAPKGRTAGPQPLGRSPCTDTSTAFLSEHIPTLRSR